MYAILIISLLLVLGTLKTIQNRKTIIDKLKSETVNAVDSNNYQELLNRVVALENGFLDRTYPVGSIYISISSTNPAQLFGGTWESFGQGRTLIGAGTGTDKNGNSKTFVFSNSTESEGEYSHRLTVSELPSNIGKFTALRWVGNTGESGAFTFQQLASDRTSGSGSNFGTALYTLSGGNNYHNNIQPYIVTYMWKRTS